ncbi:MAG: hypothetical protein JW743_09155 [Deltaproteobacteria bacterium]|nr:hypothetical protein [Deltaproteobacteria bacterium]MBN2846028.1 hypothetical protein [Deltaproteobacteria bacterium]
MYNGERKSTLIREITLFLKNRGASFIVGRKSLHKLQVKIYDYKSGKNIILEFWSASIISPSMGGFHYSSALTWKDLETFISSGPDGYSINPHIRALIYITHLKAKKKDQRKPETVVRLRYFREQCIPGESRHGLLPEILGNLAEGRENLRSGNRKALSLLKGAGAYRPVHAFLYALRMRWQEFLSGGSPLSLMAVVGPDGSGKTTILKKAIPTDDRSLKYCKFKDLYRKHNGIDKLIRKYYPEKGLKRNQIDERVSGVHFLWSSTVFFFFRILYFRKLIILDRYFYDLLLTGIRDQKQKGHEVWWHRLGCYLTPRPRCLFILDVPYEIAKKRKDEISSEDWDLIFNNYLTCYFSKPSKYLALCNTERTVNESVSFFNFVKEATLK